MQRYFARGKLLLTGEYMVLKGARALAIPSKLGQHLHFVSGSKVLHWKSYNHKGELWFSAQFDAAANILESSNTETGDFLQLLLQKARFMNSGQLPTGTVETRLDFPRNWGLGSSSTLTHLIAQWLNVDAMELFFATQNGSGYDVACAGENSALLYERKKNKAIWTDVGLLPAVFSEALFVHLNKKQNSRPEVARFLTKDLEENTLQRISEISEGFTRITNVKNLQILMQEHEQILSKVLGRVSIQDEVFSDFHGAVKSLGAWGGDFIMACGQDARSYFHSKGYSTFLSWDEIRPKDP